MCGVRQWRGVSAGSGPATGNQRASPRQNRFWSFIVARAVVGEVEPRPVTAVTRAKLWLAHGPAAIIRAMWRGDVVVMAGNGRRDGDWEEVHGGGDEGEDRPYPAGPGGGQRKCWRREVLSRAVWSGLLGAPPGVSSFRAPQTRLNCRC